MGETQNKLKFYFVSKIMGFLGDIVKVYMMIASDWQIENFQLFFFFSKNL